MEIFTFPRNTQRLSSKLRPPAWPVAWPWSAETDMLPCEMRTLRNTTLLLRRSSSEDWASREMAPGVLAAGAADTPCNACSARTDAASRRGDRLLGLKVAIDLRF